MKSYEKPIYFIKSFFEGIKNIITYIPTIYKDRNWDYGFMLTLEMKKLKEMLKWYENHDYGTHVNGWHDYLTMKWAYECLNIILNDDWWTIEYPDNWLKCDNSEVNYIIKPYINIRNYKRFLSYLSEKSLKKDPKLWSIELREEKAWRLYNKIRKQYMTTWWD